MASDDPIQEIEEAAGEVISTLREDLLGRDGYLVVLILTLLTVVIIPIDEGYRGGSIVTSLVLGLLVLTTMTRSHVSNRLRWAALAVVVASVVLAVATAIHGRRVPVNVQPADAQWLLAAGTGSYLLVLAVCFPAILRRAFSLRKVTLNTVAASLAAYLLLGIIFAFAFRFTNVVNGPFFNDNPAVDTFTYEYFSYITLTTVGYGDFTPATDAGRTLAMLEGLMGQVFLVTIVAMVVSNLGRQRTRENDPFGLNPMDPSVPAPGGGAIPLDPDDEDAPDDPVRPGASDRPEGSEAPPA